MKNLQKFAVALLVGIMAIGFSAFKSTTSKKMFATQYYQISPGVYSKTAPPSSEECVEDQNPCTLQFPNNIPAGQFDTFNYNTQLGAVTSVGGSPTPSDTEGVWQ